MKPSRLGALVAGLLASSLVVAACGGDQEPGGPETDDRPAGPATLKYSAGTARVRLSGGIRDTVRFPTVGEGRVRVPLPGEEEFQETVLTLEWVGEIGGGLTINGVAFVGSANSTSEELVVTIDVSSGFFNSQFAEECTVFLDRADARRLEGNLFCRGLQSLGTEGGPANANGEFSMRA